MGIKRDEVMDEQLRNPTNFAPDRYVKWHRQEIQEIFSKLRWDIRKQSTMDVIKWAEVSAIINKYEKQYLKET
jgi:hypothetical protein